MPTEPAPTSVVSPAAVLGSTATAFAPVEAAFSGALGLGAGRTASALAAEIRHAVGVPQHVLATCEHLGKALARTGLPVVLAQPVARRRGRKGPPRVVARVDALPFADGAIDVALTDGIPADPVAILRSLARVVRDGGLVVVATPGTALVRKPAPPELLSAALVHAGLVDVEQVLVGSVLLGLARVRKWAGG